ncbi:MAG: 16S rRNA (cytidine(1402)-2'-O)-methyltransferase [Candidatus Angelobacter sp.]
MAGSVEKGVLYVVATPIGNLDDITYRAVHVLANVDLIACEDTRHTRKLLDHYSIDRPTISYHEHNEQERAEELLQKLVSGMSIAQVSDAGMPGIADPGYRVIRLAIEHGIPVRPIPGPSALVAALVGSGLATDAFEFHGFLPSKSGQRRTALEKFRAAEHTIVLYEAPHRIQQTLGDLVEVLGPDRPLVIARELTKVHEEFIRGPAAEVRENIRQRELKGEITLLIGRSEQPSAQPPAPDLNLRLQEIMRQQNLDEKSALKALARELGQPRSQLYRELLRLRSRRNL